MWLFLTLSMYFTSKFFCAKFKNPLCNPLLFSISIIIFTLIVLGVPYGEYYDDNKLLSYFLEPAIIAMAYPIYTQLANIKKNMKLILGTCIFGSIFSMISGGFIALYLGADSLLIASVLTKSVTVPIAMESTSQLGGDVSVTAVLVLFAGLAGAIIAYPIYTLMRVNNKIIRGLTIGASSHALGTAQAIANNPDDAAYSSLALVLCGIFTSILAPLIYPIILWFI
ncbi:CidB/LrgB family autolysis modulator [Vibrio lentus]|uniref:LrgB family protein n=1 Tax=Vibrio lentus TaxID=136468 RepID=UPI0007EED4F3|nr:LrgB family protein [Vibrio lentus]OBS96981.1 CidB/LrgB family autolysis modulator [Vibrio tasmaniensis]MCC4815508.1 LrgB family protein [Vibrio lentus]PMG72629.1 CidB/LrgB family autolysis modulator [Vibrio lentus]PMK91542.1 CidB/LrgB family autolysis modulator [Vibrio lentus]PML22564.1 CidB/LrgB family autolysis modulator [Vibrio lentus]